MNALRPLLFAAAAVTALSIPDGPARAQSLSQIAAIVNRDSITMHDVEARMRLLGLGAKLPEAGEARRRLIQDVMRGLITEKLQVQEAKRLDLGVSLAEIEQAVVRIEERNRMPRGGLFKTLRGRGIDPATLVSQIQASIAWGKVVDRGLRPTIRVSDDEVNELAKRTAANKDKNQYRVFEIYLPIEATGQEAATLRNAQTLMEQLRRGASFEILARQYSQSGSAQAGGDMGFQFEGQMEPEIETVVRTMKTGQIAGPVKGLGGYYVLLLADRRTAAGRNPDVKSISIARAVFTARDRRAETVQEAQRKAAALARDRKTCDDFIKAGREAGADVQQVDDLVTDRLPQPMRGIIAALKVGEISKPATANTEVGLFMRCEDRAPGAVRTADLREALVRQRLAQAAERHLRELRRSATVDIRI